MKSKVLITGSSGFIGKNLINFLKVKNEFSLVTVSRDDLKLNDEIKNHFQIRSISSSTDWSEPLKGVDVVIHLAGIAHRSGTLEEYEEINVNGAIKIAKQAIEAKVKRLIYISSIKVNGEKTLSGKAFKADDLPNPQDSYAKSKYKVESELRRISVESDLEVVIIRPALVYGPGVKSNFLNLMKWIKNRIGVNRTKLISKWKTFIDMGVPIPGGSDCPIEDGNPLFEIFAAVTRKDHKGWPENGWHPEQCVDRISALKMFTKWAAYGSFSELKRGKIKEGYDADITIVDLEKEKIVSGKDMQSKCGWNAFDGQTLKGWPNTTIVNGHIVYQNGIINTQFLGKQASFNE